ncbi:MAG TPA: hypothetical protein VF022_09020 [Rhodanobacteraceae bacterium]|jgi:ElaB/YqjD/DUF883 family membrane-anchored ribosome-binding protein
MRIPHKEQTDMNERASSIRTGNDGALKRDFQNVVDAAEALLRTTADQASAEWRNARDSLEHKVQTLRSNLSGSAQEFTVQARELGGRGAQLIRRYPWASVGVGAAAGLLAGLLIRGRRGNGW